MVFKRRLNLHIEVEGLGFKHYNTRVNLSEHHVCNGMEFPILTPIVWVTCMYCLLWQLLIIIEDLIPTCNTHI
jgi:hypothetical protein